jgi:hypothetical protein
LLLHIVNDSVSKCSHSRLCFLCHFPYFLIMLMYLTSKN